MKYRPQLLALTFALGLLSYREQNQSKTQNLITPLEKSVEFETEVFVDARARVSKSKLSW